MAASDSGSEAHSSAPPSDRAPDQAADEQTSLRVLNEPSQGLPDVQSDLPGLRRAIGALTEGTGPVAVDAERAHGFRYSQRAYLLQLRRRGSGTILIDPVALGPDGSDPNATPPDLSDLAARIDDAEWVIHAANQDLPCLAELNLLPKRLFDTELAGRLLGYPRVNLGTLLEENFQVKLLKEHSAADWSTRPLPQEWLNYAALDVELLLELRDALAEQLAEAGKDGWAQQEFAWLAEHASDPVETRQDPWRRTSGIHRIRNRRGLGVVVQLWQARDRLARRTDRAPGRILPDAAITELAAINDPTPAKLAELPAFRRRAARRYRNNWVTALDRALAMPDSELPPLHRRSDGPPQQARAWANRDPDAAARLKQARKVLTDTAAELNLPPENLLTPDHLRRLAWRPPDPVQDHQVDRALAELGARSWQREIVVGLLTPALQIRASG